MDSMRDKGRILLLLALAAIVASIPAQAHQGASHQNLSRSALAYLVENDPDFACAGGLDTVLAVGAVDEDANPRYVFHFDPALWLTQSSCTARQWGLTRTNCTSLIYSAVNNHSWLDAVEKATDPATGLPSDAGWLDLGYVLHLLEDMSSPAHVRNDAHLAYDPFESITNGRAVGTFNGPLLSFGSADQFFTGLRDYTQANYYSDDTVFDPRFPGPASASEDAHYFYDGSGRRIAYKGLRYYSSCQQAGPSIVCNRRLAAIDRTIAREQWDAISPAAVEYVASLIRYYYDAASPLVTLVHNGSFESGDLAGWTRGNLYGCDFPQYAGPSGAYEAVVTGNTTDGTWAARLGKWTQVYTGGLHGPALPGEEPCGYNYVYQDITIPADVTSAQLEFDYDVREYDTANWSWFDVQLRAPASNGVLATVVNRAGKPGLDYGTYWDGGWKTSTFDLSPWKGQSVRLWFGVRQDGWGDQIATWTDRVKVTCQH